MSEEDLVSRRSPCREAAAPSPDQQLVQMTASMNHHLTDLLAVLQEREQERDLLKKELNKYRDQVRGYLSQAIAAEATFAAGPACNSSPLSTTASPPSRPVSFISVESDGLMELETSSAADHPPPRRPHSFLSLESDSTHSGELSQEEEGTTAAEERLHGGAAEQPSTCWGGGESIESDSRVHGPATSIESDPKAGTDSGTESDKPADSALDYSSPTIDTLADYLKPNQLKLWDSSQKVKENYPVRFLFKAYCRLCSF